MKSAARLAVVSALLYVAAITVRPLNANDLFWHLATGREILRTGSLPRTDPFSFTSGGAAWIDHEWLWQVAAQGIDAASGQRPGQPPAVPANLALILSGELVCLAAFGLGLLHAARKDLPVAALAGFGLLAAEAARDRLMVRPETASLGFLAIFLAILGSRTPGLRRGLLLAFVTAVWANVHPAVLLSPVLVFLWTIGELSSRKLAASELPRERPLGALTRLLAEPLAVAAGTLLNPYGWHLWTVPFQLRGLVKNAAFYNPEWLPPPLARFPFFYACALLVLAGAVVAMARTKRLPAGPVLVALLLAAISSRQMRHMGLFAVAFLFSAAPLLKALDLRDALARILDRRAIGGIACAGVLLASASTLAGSRRLLADGGLDPGRFPVRACEEIAKQAPGLRLYNDVRFGGYLIWRFYPERKVFIDGRNEVYPSLLARLGHIHSGEAPYQDWRDLIRESGIEGAIVQYNETRKGVLYPPAVPGGPAVPGYRAWSAFLFPDSEWALVGFDDTALVFMKRGGKGESWIARGEYRALNPEDSEYLLDRAAHEPAFAGVLRSEAARRLRTGPPSRRLEQLIEDLDRVAPPHGVPR